MTAAITTCIGCNTPMVHSRTNIPAGYVPHEARGYCKGCYKHVRPRGAARIPDVADRIPTRGDPSGDWKKHAACGPATAHLFDPPTSRTHNEHLRIERARSICASCPVTLPCLEEALRDPIACGVHAGRLILFGQVAQEPNWRGLG